MTKELAVKILNGEVLGTTEQTYLAVSMAIKAFCSSKTLVRCVECRYRMLDNGEYVCRLDSAYLYERTRRADKPGWFCADGDMKD